MSGMFRAYPGVIYLTKEVRMKQWILEIPTNLNLNDV